MRMRFVFILLLFLPSHSICRSKVRDDNFHKSDGPGIEDKFADEGQEVKTEYRSDSKEFTDYNDYYWYPLCGDVPM